SSRREKQSALLSLFERGEDTFLCPAQRLRHEERVQAGMGIYEVSGEIRGVAALAHQARGSDGARPRSPGVYQSVNQAVGKREIWQPASRLNCSRYAWKHTGLEPSTRLPRDCLHAGRNGWSCATCYAPMVLREPRSPCSQADATRKAARVGNACWRCTGAPCTTATSWTAKRASDGRGCRDEHQARCTLPQNQTYTSSDSMSPPRHDTPPALSAPPARRCRPAP